MPGNGNIITYKRYNGKQEYNSPDDFDNLEYIVVGDGKKGGYCMTLYPGRNLLAVYKNKSLSFTVPNVSQPQKNYIGLKIYLENYRIT